LFRNWASTPGSENSHDTACPKPTKPSAIDVCRDARRMFRGRRRLTFVASARASGSRRCTALHVICATYFEVDE
jgi:hypothetical protein